MAVKTRVTEVQVFRSGATVTRCGEVSLTAGRNVVYISGMTNSTVFDSYKLKFPEKVVDGGKVWFRRERTGVEAGADVGLERIGERHDVVERPRPVADGEETVALGALEADDRLAVAHEVPPREQEANEVHHVFCSLFSALVAAARLFDLGERVADVGIHRATGKEQRAVLAEAGEAGRVEPDAVRRQPEELQRVRVRCGGQLREAAQRVVDAVVALVRHLLRRRREERVFEGRHEEHAADILVASL